MTDDQSLIPSSGYLKGATHYYPMRVYYEDTDALGIVYHANYLKFMERARTEFLRNLGILNPELANRDDGMTWAVASVTLNYLLPAKPDDALLIVTHVNRLGAASVTIEQHIMRGDETISKGVIKVGSMDKNGRPRRMPKDLKQKFTDLEKQLTEKS